MMLGKGVILKQCIGMQDSCYASMTDNGLEFIMVMRNPTADEVNSVKQGNSFALRCTSYGGMIVFVLRCGQIAWQDATYTPLLGNAPSNIVLTGNALPLTVLIVNSINGYVEAMATHVLTGKFVRDLLRDVATLVYDTTLTALQVDVNRTALYASYTTRQLAEICRTRYKSVFGRGDQPDIISLYNTAQLRPSLRDVAGSVRDIPYPRQLPDALVPYHVYITDAGHCLMCVPRCLLEEARKAGSLDMYEVSIPVKYVLDKGYEVIDENHITVDVTYDPMLGAVVGDDWSEF